MTIGKVARNRLRTYSDLEFESNIDEQLLEAYQYYFYWKSRFYRYHHISAAQSARKYLRQMELLVIQKKREILNQQKRVKKKQK